MIWRCAGDFFTEIQNGRHRSIKIFWGVQNVKVGNYLNFNITLPTMWRWASDFFKVLLKFKMAAMDNLLIFVGTKTAKLKSVIIHIVQSHHPPSTNVHVILPKFKMSITNKLFKYFWPQINLIYGGGWDRTSGLLLIWVLNDCFASVFGISRYFYIFFFCFGSMLCSDLFSYGRLQLFILWKYYSRNLNIFGFKS